MITEHQLSELKQETEKNYRTRNFDQMQAHISRGASPCPVFWSMSMKRMGDAKRETTGGLLRGLVGVVTALRDQSLSRNGCINLSRRIPSLYLE